MVLNGVASFCPSYSQLGFGIHECAIASGWADLSRPPRPLPYVQLGRWVGGWLGALQDLQNIRSVLSTRAIESSGTQPQGGGRFES